MRPPQAGYDGNVAVLLAVLGMHRSGTSATAGLLSEHGVELGPVSEKNKFNPRGNREIQQLNRLHDRILERSGGSWSEPPEQITTAPADYIERDEILATIPGEVRGVKDPRMLIAGEFWSDLEPKPIGVLRNPVAVTSSLLRRAKDRPRRHPQLPAEAWERLWCHYNEALLAELERKDFPLIDFDRHSELDDQLRAALQAHGIEPRGDGGFFEPDLVAGSAEEWRQRVIFPETLELWERIAGRAIGV